MSSEIRQSIVSWLHTQSLWTQRTAEKILKREDITDSVLNELLDCLKSEEGIKTGKLIDFSFFSGLAENDATLKVQSIGDIQGIDDLAPKTPLIFGDNLSVIYGHNGSGKSGYTRILKKACGKIGAVDLISNVFKDIPAHRKCSISFNVNDALIQKEWTANSAPIAQLRGVDIFDSTSGGAYLEGETEATYMPVEVALFEKLVQTFDLLKLKLDKSSSELISKLPAKPTQFGTSKFIEGMYTRLKNDSKVEELKKFYNYTADDEEKQKALEERIKTAPSELASQKHKRKMQVEGLLNAISAGTTSVSQSVCDEVENLRSDFAAKKKASLDAAKVLADDSKLQGIGEATWKSMWLAAKKYSEEIAYKGSDFPKIDENSVCVLCHQDLDQNAKKRMSGFNDYIKGQLQTELKKAEELYQQKISLLPSIPTESDLKTVLQACQLDEEKWLPVVKGIWSDIESVKTNLVTQKDDKVTGYAYDKKLLEEVDNLKQKLVEEIAVHTKDSESFDISRLQIELNDFKAKKWASGYVEVMLEEIDRLKGLNLIIGWTKLVSTSGLSKKAGEISEKILTEAYVERFNRELKALGANKISVELVKARATKGKVKHKLQLKNVNLAFSKAQLNPLSDGEKRIISLAAFLADVMGKSYKAPFVFDDPISSLDQSYEENTAQRLIELSKDRQVIVFTHRLSLLGLLSETDNVHSRHIRREHWGCGEHGEIPLYGNKPINAVRKLKNERVAQARKTLSESGTDQYNVLAKSICSDFRILLERIIEHELLKGIVQRHKGKVTTDGKLAAISKIQQSDCDLLEGLMSEFSKHEHSQSDEAPVELPDPENLDKALDSILSWHTEFSKRAV